MTEKELIKSIESLTELTKNQTQALEMNAEVIKSLLERIGELEKCTVMFSEQMNATEELIYTHTDVLSEHSRHIGSLYDSVTHSSNSITKINNSLIEIYDLI